MGCSINKESIESEILILQLQKIKIKDERKKMLKKYKDLTGESLIRPKIPEYIDYKTMKEMKINKYSKDIKITKESSTSTKINSRKFFFETQS